MSTDLNSLRIDPAMKSNGADGGRLKGVLLGSVVAAVVVAVVLVVWGRKPESPAAAVPAVAVSPAVAKPDAAPAGDVVLQATGYVVAAHKIELAPKVIGRVAWVGVDMGDRVKRGQELVRLEDDEYNARVLQVQGQLDAAKAKLAELEAGSRPEEIVRAEAEVEQALADEQNARKTVARNAKVEATSPNAISEQQVDEADARLRAATARVAAIRADLALAKAGPRREQIDAQRAAVVQAQGALAAARLDLDNTVIRAPVDGTILSRNVEVGEFVTTGFVGDNGAKGFVVSIADLRDLLVELDVSQNDFQKVGPKQPATVTTDAYPDRKYDGVVDQISPEANRSKATILVKVKVLNPDDLLKPDMNATVAFRPAGEGEPRRHEGTKGAAKAEQ